MPIPVSDREVYDKNPLEQVICQLRFPTILRVDLPPIDYQEVVRSKYPLFRQHPSGQSLIPPEVTKEMPKELLDALLPTGNPTYNFLSLDEKWAITINRDFFSLTTTDYKNWEDFRNHLSFSFEAFVATYSPAILTRVGLRYVNVIRKASIGLDETPWAALLNPHIASVLASEVGEAVVDTAHNHLFRLNDNIGVARMRHGFLRDDSQQAIGYLIDNDLFTDEPTEVKHAFSLLDSFNRQNGWIFRWAIQDTLRTRLGITA